MTADKSHPYRLVRAYIHLNGDRSVALVDLCVCQHRTGPVGGVCVNCAGAIPSEAEANDLGLPSPSKLVAMQGEATMSAESERLVPRFEQPTGSQSAAIVPTIPTTPDNLVPVERASLQRIVDELGRLDEVEHFERGAEAYEPSPIRREAEAILARTEAQPAKKTGDIVDGENVHVLADEIVGLLLAELGKRRGFRATMDDIDEDVMQELRQACQRAVEEHLVASGYGGSPKPRRAP